MITTQNRRSTTSYCLWISSGCLNFDLYVSFFDLISRCCFILMSGEITPAVSSNHVNTPRDGFQVLCTLVKSLDTRFFRWQLCVSRFYVSTQNLEIWLFGFHDNLEYLFVIESQYRACWTRLRYYGNELLEVEFCYILSKSSEGGIYCRCLDPRLDQSDTQYSSYQNENEIWSKNISGREQGLNYNSQACFSKPATVIPFLSSPK